MPKNCNCISIVWKGLCTVSRSVFRKRKYSYNLDHVSGRQPSDVELIGFKIYDSWRTVKNFSSRIDVNEKSVEDLLNTLGSSISKTQNGETVNQAETFKRHNFTPILKTYPFNVGHNSVLQFTKPRSDTFVDHIVTDDSCSENDEDVVGDEGYDDGEEHVTFTTDKSPMDSSLTHLSNGVTLPESDEFTALFDDVACMITSQDITLQNLLMTAEFEDEVSVHLPRSVTSSGETCTENEDPCSKNHGGSVGGDEVHLYEVHEEDEESITFTTDQSSMDSLPTPLTDGATLLESEYTALLDELAYIRSKLTTLQVILTSEIVDEASVRLPQSDTFADQTCTEIEDSCSEKDEEDNDEDKVYDDGDEFVTLVTVKLPSESSPTPITSEVTLPESDYIALVDELAFIKFKLNTLQNLLRSGIEDEIPLHLLRSIAFADQTYTETENSSPENDEEDIDENGIYDDGEDCVDSTTEQSLLDSLPSPLMNEVTLPQSEYAALLDELTYMRSQIIKLQKFLTPAEDNEASLHGE